MASGISTRGFNQILFRGVGLHATGRPLQFGNQHLTQTGVRPLTVNATVTALRFFFKVTLDESSLGLAPIVVEPIGDILMEMQKREGISIILAEQNANWAMPIANRAVILELSARSC
jgi:hypothetical protein